MKVEMTQYLRPDGRARKVYPEVEDEIAELAKDMFLSTEVLRNGTVTIYARFHDEGEEDEDLEFAENNDTDPIIKLAELIKRKALQRKYKNNKHSRGRNDEPYMPSM